MLTSVLRYYEEKKKKVFSVSCENFALDGHPRQKRKGNEIKKENVQRKEQLFQSIFGESTHTILTLT